MAKLLLNWIIIRKGNNVMDKNGRVKAWNFGIQPCKGLGMSRNKCSERLKLLRIKGFIHFEDVRFLRSPNVDVDGGFIKKVGCVW